MRQSTYFIYLPILLFSIYTDGIHIEYIANQRLRTHDGYFPNSYGQYHIWEIFGLGLKIKVFCTKKIQQPNTQNHGQGTHSAKMDAVYFCRKYPKCPQNFRLNLSAQAQKFGIFEKALSWCS